MKAVCKISLALTAMVFVGCAQQAPVELPPPEPEVAVEPEPQLPPRPFTSDTLYALLGAELAGSRGRYDVALANYAQQAEQTRDPAVAQRAYRIARYLNNDSVALKSAQIWAETDPNNPDAQASAILALIDADRLLEAFDATLNSNQLDNGALYQSIAANAQQATDLQREQLLTEYQRLLQQTPDNTALLIGTGLLLQQQGDNEQALALAERARAIEPGNTHALVLTTGLLHQMGENERALELITDKLNEDPNNTRARLQYARLLTFSDLAAAQVQFQQLVDANPHDTDMLRALALVAEERGDLLTAESSYHSLLSLNAHTNAAHFFLGKLAESREQWDDALDHYTAISLGEEFAAANGQVFAIYLKREQLASANNHYQRIHALVPEELREQVTLIYSQRLIEGGYSDQSLTLLNDALVSAPHSSSLLYTRSMLHEQLGNHELAEHDLRTIIEYDPENAMALNALGYILTENTSRYSEAYELIKRALELQPDDPATIDSLGWVHYRLGNLEIAIRYLRKAIMLYPDHEIAAHLGEALWMNNQLDEARNVWRQGLEIHPGSHHILDTLQRFELSPEQLQEP